MQQYKRHTELTHHILSEDEYDEWYDYNNNGWYYLESEPMVDYKCNRATKMMSIFVRNRYGIYITTKEESIYLVDMDSINYSKKIKRDKILSKILDKELDTKNTIESIIRN